MLETIAWCAGFDAQFSCCGKTNPYIPGSILFDAWWEGQLAALALFGPSEVVELTVIEIDTDVN